MHLRNFYSTRFLCSYSYKKALWIFLFFSLGVDCYSQIRFERGYFIDSIGQKTECLIKNNDWRYNPESFKYKVSEDSEIKTGTGESVQEFGIYNESTYVSRLVKIDRSSHELRDMTANRQPVFEGERLFLKVLVTGKANLYSYQAESFQRFFYDKEGDTIQQLVYKPYRTTDFKVAENTTFRQQLLNDLVCKDFSLEDFSDLEYSRRALSRLFSAYGKCHGVEVVDFGNARPTKSRGEFNLTIRPGLRYSSLKIDNRMVYAQPMDYGDQFGWRLGLEAELILPFHGNKWGLVVEPTYQYFNSDVKTIRAPELMEREYVSSAQYKSIELLTSLRYYFFLNARSKIYINASYVMDFSFDSYMEARRLDGSVYFETLSVSAAPTWGIGVGFKYLDRYSLELQYQKSRDIFSSYVFWQSEYRPISLVFGFTIF